MDSHPGKLQQTTTARAWPVTVAAFLGVMILAGGTSAPADGMVYLQSGLSLIILVIALVRLAAQGLPTRLAKYASWLAILAALLRLLQLVPLPPSLWSLLPTHQLALKNLGLIGAAPGFMPLSLAPEATRLDALALLPALAAFFAILTIPARQLITCCWVILICAGIGLCLALAQIAQDETSPFYFYGGTTGVASGVFGNRNFFAAQFAASIVITGLIAAKLRQKQNWAAWLAALAAAGMIMLLLVGIALSGSRMGFLLAMLATLFALVILYSGIATLNVKTSAISLLAVLAAIFVVGQSSMVGLLRLTNMDPFSDLRANVAFTTLGMLRETLPFGSGFGSFVPLYQMHETPDMLMPEFVNHVHNDWLELALEGGIPAMLLESLFVIWVVAALIRVWRYGRGGSTALFQRAASLILPLLLIHSAVDFPLRTPALMCLFAFCCAVMCLPPEVTQTASRTAKPRPQPVPVRTPAPFRPRQASFGRGNRES